MPCPIPRLRSAGSSLIAALFLLGGVAGRAALPGARLASVAFDGGPALAPARSDTPSVSADGRFVAFRSDAMNFATVPEADWINYNGYPEVFVKDTQTGSVVLASCRADGDAANGICYTPSISADGRRVAFTSQARNFAAGTNQYFQVFVKDLATGAILLASAAADGTPGNSHCSTPSLSGDGQRVMFTSSATNLVPGDTNARRDVFVKDLGTGAVFPASTAADGGVGNNDSGSLLGPGSAPTGLTDDGRFAAFVSSATNLVPGDTNARDDVFVKDLQTGTILRASSRSDGVQADGASGRAGTSISADGRYVVFGSDATNLVSSDTNGGADVFVKDLLTGGIVRASTLSDGSQARVSSGFVGPTISGDGRFVAFDGSASAFLPGESRAMTVVLVKDLQTGVVIHASPTSTGTVANGASQQVSLSRNGTHIGFRSVATDMVPGRTPNPTEVYVRSLAADQTTRVSTTEDGGEAVSHAQFGPAPVSADGRFVAMASDAFNLVPDEGQPSGGAFLRDLKTAITISVDASAAGQRAHARATDVSLSPDGRFVAFISGASLVPDDTNFADDVYLKDLKTGSVARASLRADGSQPLPYGWPYVGTSLSDDGRYVAFSSEAPDLVPGDTNSRSDVFVKDLQSGALVLASTSAEGSPGNENSGSAGFVWSQKLSLSADGSHVGFVSRATNLVPNDTNGAADVFVKDLRTGAIVRASVSTGGAQGNANSSFSRDAISADGRYVAFYSEADNLVPGDTNSVWDVFVKDLLTGTLTRVSCAEDGTQGDSYSDGPCLSANGRYAAFRSYATNLVPGSQFGTIQVYVRELTTGKLARISDTAEGVPGNNHSTEPILSSNGRYVAFVSLASNLVPEDTNRGADVLVRETGFNTAGTPEDLALHATGPKVKVSFSDQSADEKSFEIWRDVGTGLVRRVTLASTTVAQQGGTVTFVDPAPLNVHCYYAVRALRPSGPTPLSPQAEVATAAPPSGLVVTSPASTTVHLSFVDRSTTETGFEVLRATASTGPFSVAASVASETEAGTGATLTADDPAAAADTSYFYTVRAVNDGAESLNATPRGVKTVAPPRSLTVQGAGASAQITFIDGSSTETQFEVFRKVGVGGTFARLKTLTSADGPGAGTTVSASDGSLLPNTDYSYQVRARNATAYSAFTPAVSLNLPAVPTGFTVKATSGAACTATLVDRSTAETGFELWRDDGSGYARVATVPSETGAGTGATLTLTDTSLEPNRSYGFKARAVNSSGASGFTVIRTVATLGAPLGLTATAVTRTSIRLSWTPNAPAASGFRVYRRRASVPTFTLVRTISGGTSSAFTDSAAAPDTGYVYTVVAYNASGVSSASNEAEAHTPP